MKPEPELAYSSLIARWCGVVWLAGWLGEREIGGVAVGVNVNAGASLENLLETGGRVDQVVVILADT